MHKAGIAAVGGAAFLATGLLSGVAHASSGGPVEPSTPPDSGDQNTNRTSGTNPVEHDLIGINAPIDLHEGVANNLHVHDVLQNVVSVGDVVPLPADVTAQGSGNASGGSGGDPAPQSKSATPSATNASASGGTSESGKPGDAPSTEGGASGGADEAAVEQSASVTRSLVGVAANVNDVADVNDAVDVRKVTALAGDVFQ